MEQINNFISRLYDARNNDHLSYMKRFQGRIQTGILQTLGTDCPQKLQTLYAAFVAAVEGKDELFLIIFRSALTQQIKDRRKEFFGLRPKSTIASA